MSSNIIMIWFYYQDNNYILTSVLGDSNWSGAIVIL